MHKKCIFFVYSFYTDIFCQYEAVILQPISKNNMFND